MELISNIDVSSMFEIIEVLENDPYIRQENERNMDEIDEIIRLYFLINDGLDFEDENENEDESYEFIMGSGGSSPYGCSVDYQINVTKHGLFDRNSMEFKFNITDSITFINNHIIDAQKDISEGNTESVFHYIDEIFLMFAIFYSCGNKFKVKYNQYNTDYIIDNQAIDQLFIDFHINGTKKSMINVIKHILDEYVKNKTYVMPTIVI